MAIPGDPEETRSNIRALLGETDLIIDSVYRGPRAGNAGDDAIGPLMGVSNMGGFRYLGSLDAMKMLVLSTGKPDPVWPDGLDRETGVFTYFGDNRSPAHALHSTPRYGNRILNDLFRNAAAGSISRGAVPPIFVFESTGHWRDVVFAGLAVPATRSGQDDDLVAIWRTDAGRRFQNYRSRFTIIDAPTISRAWIDDILSGTPITPNTPAAWKAWVESGFIEPLLSPATTRHRLKSAQLPTNASDLRLVATMRSRFANNPFGFEVIAAALVSLSIANVQSLDLTRPYRDGGRDGVGQVRVGARESSIMVDFAIEAKCYSATHGVGVHEVSRLISRLRHRQFGVLVTTSYLSAQAYQEIVADGHPIVVISAADIVKILRDQGIDSTDALDAWLTSTLASATSESPSSITA